MLRITQNTSAEAATKYFDEGLSKSDYYAEKDEIAGHWGGRAAQTLNLTGTVQKEQFHQLCHNINPETGKRLTARTDKNRRIGYDFTFSVPKSVSITHSYTGDKDIMSALDGAVQYAMGEAEKRAQARVRSGGKNTDRETGNLLWASFTHTDARPVNSVPDPHLHTHVFVFNATYDKEDEKWKAGQFGKLKADAPYYEALFHNRLACELQKVGYRIERNERDFEIAGFKRETIEKFSRRTQEVNEKIEAMGLEYAEDKAKVGARTRAGKRTGLDKEALKKEWASRLDAKELKLIHEAKSKGDQSETAHGGQQDAAENAVSFALSHGLERKSVIEHKEIMTLALKHSMGKASPEKLESEIKSRKELLSKGKDLDRVYTSKAVLREEQKLVQAARSGRNQFKPVHEDYEPKNPLLNIEQRQAVKHALQSKDLITVITGKAGSGKTWSMKEIADGAKAKGIGFHAFAPSASASRGTQREEGFKDATTIAALLQDHRLQLNIKKSDVIWLDEAGLVGVQTLNSVIDIAHKTDARLLLTGDTRQHTSQERGDALRVLKKFGGVKPAYINNIQRQKKEVYREAIKALSNGEIEKGYRTLDGMGAIRESGSFEETVIAISNEYVAARQKKEDVLVISTTHNQGKILTERIREALKKDGKLGKKDRIFETQDTISLTVAEKGEKASYEKGQAIQFHQNAPGFKRGDKYDVIGKDEKGNVLIQARDMTRNLPLKEAGKFTVYEKTKTLIAKGDHIRITQNGFSLEKRRLNNGSIVEITGFDKNGNIQGKAGRNEVTIDKNYRNLTHGYYTTSPGSQGKSVNRVLVLQTSAAGKAASREQFYVSASRGKFEISIHTDDKSELLEAVQKSSERMSATELMSPAREKSRTDAIKERLLQTGEAMQERTASISDAIKDRFQRNKPEKSVDRSR